MEEDKYNPKSKGLPRSWRALPRKLPRTLGTFQILVLAGFLSLLIVRSTIGIGRGNLARQYPTAADDEYGKEEQRRLQDSGEVADGEPKRNLVQTEVVDKLRQTVQVNDDVEVEEKMVREVTVHPDAKVRAATGKDVKDDKAERSRTAVDSDEEKKPVVSKTRKDAKDVKEDRGQQAVKTKPVVAKAEAVEEELVGIIEQVDLQLREEETEDELAEFEKIQKGKKEGKVSSTDEPTKEVELVDKELDIDSKEENSVESATTEKSPAEPKAEEKVRRNKPVDDTKSEEDESVDAMSADNGKDTEEKVQDSEPEQPRKLTSEEVRALTEEAIANMSKAIRRDDPNAYTMGPKISDWDEQRATWLEKNPDMKSTNPHKPKVLLLSGSQPVPCNDPVGDHYLLKTIKNKVDYARIHKMETFYNLAHLDKPMSHFWAKLPLIRKMMLMRPEMEWIFWMDSDALFTDMVFEIPFERYQEHNLVMWGYPEGIYDQRSWVACNTGVMFLRNSQWTLDLLEVWSHMGPGGEIRTVAGKILTSYLTFRPEMMADDQSALVFLMLTMPELRPKIFLEDEYWLSGYWVDLVSRYEEFSEKSRPGAGGRNWPFTTHFTGCQPCTGKKNEMYEGNSCLQGLEKAFNFADNQVLRPFGFEHENLYESKVLRIRNETTKPIWSVPVDNPWAVDSFYS